MAQSNRSGSARWRKIWSGYVRTLEGLVATLLFTTVAVTFVNVVRRSLGYGTYSWADETSRRFLVWLTFIGAALAIVRASHLRIDAIIDGSGPRATRVLQVIVSLVSIGFFLLLMIEGGRFALTTTDRVTPGMSVTAVWTTGIFPVGGLLCLISFFGVLYFGPPGTTASARAPDPDDAPAVADPLERGGGG